MAKLKVTQIYYIETSESRESIGRCFADSVNFMMDPDFVGLDIRDLNTDERSEINFDVDKITTIVELMTKTEKEMLDALLAKRTELSAWEWHFISTLASRPHKPLSYPEQHSLEMLYKKVVES